MMKYLLFIVCMCLPTSAWALTASQIGVSVMIEYDEPTTSIDENGQGVPLDDLATTNISIEFNGSSVMADSISATSPNGGGHIKHIMTVDMLMGQKKVFDVVVVATDESKNVSTPTTTSLLIDRQAPGPVQ